MLGCVRALQVFVQVLDACFENVCELDLVFHYEKVRFVSWRFLPSLHEYLVPPLLYALPQGGPPVSVSVWRCTGQLRT